jgi:hypothetical protein
MEFSSDLKHLFVSTSSGVTRISGLGDVYSSESNFKTKVGYSTAAPAASPTATTSTKISNVSYEGLAINPRNSNDLLLLAGFSGVNRRTSNASTATSTSNLSSTILQSITNPGVACYDGIIDRLDDNVLVVGTSSGVFISEDGGVTWENASAGFEGTPVFEVRQQWRSFDQGSYRSGEIYVGTYGRGIWSTAAYLGVNDNNEMSLTNFKTKLKSYPNPTNESTTLSFNLAKTGDVDVQVYSITGRLVKSINKKNLSSGENTLFIDCDDIPNGTYIVKFVSGKQVESVKFIKL